MLLKNACKTNISDGFSLMEMMIVLLITAIIAAATAPMINRKMLENQAANGSPWVYLSDATNDVAYNLGGKDQTASIGALKFPLKSTSTIDANKPAMFIKTAVGKPQISLLSTSGSASADNIVSIGTNDSSIFMTSHGKLKDISKSTNSVIIDRKPNISTETTSTTLDKVTIVGYNNEVSAKGATAIGYNVNTNMKDSIVIGREASVTDGGDVKARAIAIGTKVIASNSDTIAIGGRYGKSTTAKGIGAIALGTPAIASGNFSIAIGGTASTNASVDDDSSVSTTTASDTNAIAIGTEAAATHTNSVAIGAGAKTKAAYEIVLGTPDTTVYIPGNLVVDKNVLLGRSGYTTSLHANTPDSSGAKGIRSICWRNSYNAGHWSNTNTSSFVGEMNARYSDRRLKNVGKPFTGGLEEIKKLEVFNYTFKKDPEKTPRVGVMAQDLEKIFPKAVFKGDDGFLRIRMEDMFYALVNAIKELSNKIDSLMNKEIATLQKQVSELEKQNQEIKKLNEDLIKRIEKLEKAKK